MYTENEKQAYAERITALARKTGVPYGVCLALSGEEAKIELLKECLSESVNKDLSSLENSFLYNHFSEHINIDATTGAVTDYGVPYDYRKELYHKDIRRQLAAVQKVLKGITGQTFLYAELELASTPKKNASIVISYIADFVIGKLYVVSMREALAMLDENHFSDLSRGVFVVSKHVKQLRSLWVLRSLNIKEVVLPYGVTVIRPFAFENVGLEKVQLSRTVSHIRTGAFYGCNLTSVEFPSNKFLKEIGHDAFSGNQIKELVIPENIETFDMYSFRKNPIEKITVGQNTTVFHVPEEIPVIRQ